MPTYEVPGVYIQEITGPGVIVGVSTSVTAFVGPALAGPIGVAQSITFVGSVLPGLRGPAVRRKLLALHHRTPLVLHGPWDQRLLHQRGIASLRDARRNRGEHHLERQ